MIQRICILVVVLLATEGVDARSPRALGRDLTQEPQLRFLSWSHEVPDDPTEPLASDYWYANGERVTKPRELEPLRRIRGATLRRTRSLNLFFSHSDFDDYSYGRVSLVATNGRIVDPKMPWRTDVLVRRAEREGEAGWMCLTVVLPDDISVPSVGTVQLSYAIGPWEGVTRFSAATDTFHLDEGVCLLVVGQQVDRKSFATIGIDPCRERVQSL